MDRNSIDFCSAIKPRESAAETILPCTVRYKGKVKSSRLAGSATGDSRIVVNPVWCKSEYFDFIEMVARMSLIAISGLDR